MARDSSLEAGSDSFLDIIANIVGILIILIVVAGMRVSQAPVPAPVQPLPVKEITPEVTYNTPVLIPDAAPPLNLPEEELPSVGVIPPTLPVATRPTVLTSDVFAVVPPKPNESTAASWFSDLPPTPEAPAAPAISEELVNAIAATKLLLQQMQAELEQTTASTEKFQQEYVQLLQQARLTRDNVNAKTDELRQARAILTAKQAEIKQLEDGVEAARKQVATLEKLPTRGKQLKHIITPVSQLVEGKELHFQLSGNRIAHVPLEAFLAQLKGHIERKKEWLMKYNQHEGAIGPIEGFTMEYAVQREGMTALEQLNQGVGLVRISLSSWTIKPDPGPQYETYDEALALEGRFRRVLQRVPAGSTLTFWTYPDSFPLFRQLQAVAHENGFRVAGRPLPQGVQISGSPSGSRSAGQ